MIDPDTLSQDDEDSEPDRSGWLRGIRVEQSWLSQRGPLRIDTLATSVNAFADSPNYGTLSLYGTHFWQQQEADPQGLAGNSDPLLTRASNWRLDQRALPLGGGWSASHSLGTTTPYVLPMSYAFGQMPLPSSPLRGAAGEWSNQAGATRLVAATGRTGYFSGIDVNSFQDNDATMSTFGGQTRLAGGDGPDSSRLDAAVQYFDARNQVTTGFALPDRPVVRHDVRSLWTSLSWQGRAWWATDIAKGSGPLWQRDGGLRVQANLLHSDSSVAGGARGQWLESAWANGAWRQHAGLYSFDPALYWGATPRNLDLRGAYLRSETGTRRWQFGLSGEFSEHVSSPSSPVLFSSAYGLYRLDTHNSVGMTVGATAGSSSAESIRLNWNHQGRFGRTQLQGEYAWLDGGNASRVRLDNEWPTGQWWSLATSVGMERREVTSYTAYGEPVAPYQAFVWGVLASASPQPRIRFDASVRGANGSGASSLNASVNAAWQLSRNWSVVMRYTDARGHEPLSPLLASGLNAALQSMQAPVLTSRVLQLSLRFEESAGSSFAPIGGQPGTGFGRLIGIVYFDRDNDGQRTASEGGAPGVTVVLDGRYLTRTDADGRYEFPAVAIGEHRIEIQPDNVPLPWSPVDRESRPTSVSVRQDTTVEFGLQRTP